MALIPRIPTPVRDTLAVQYHANYGNGESALALSDATAVKLRTRPSQVASMLRKVSNNQTVAATTIASAVSRSNGAVPIADGAADVITETVAAQVKSIVYTIRNNGTVFLTLADAAISSLVNCTVSIDPVWQVEQPAIDAAGSISTVVGATVPQPSNVPAGATSAFALLVTPTAVGAWSLAISFGSNDVTKNPYNWTISGTAVAATPELNVALFGGGAAIPDGGTDTVLGTTAGVLTSHGYDIANAGGAELGITIPVLRSALVNCTVGVFLQPTATVAPFTTVPFVVEITPTAPGAWSFNLSMANTDATENPYNWTVDGVAV